MKADFDIHDYLRPKKRFPHVWCPGCGLGIVLGAIVRAVHRLELDKNDVAMISGIGCTGRMPVYVDFNTMHTTHGRALAFATGLKMAKPNMHIVAVMGDGDALAIGGNHFVHSCRRNIGITAIIVDNNTYGMTGGQYSPTTPRGAFATTAPYGNLEQPFPVCEIAEAAGAAFVARGTVYHAVELGLLLEKALRKDGFSVVEVISYCHTTFGRRNKLGSAVDMMRGLKENSISVERAARLQPDEIEGKIIRGVLSDREIPEYTQQYDTVIARAQANRGPESV